MIVKDATGASAPSVLDDSSLTDEVLAAKAPWYVMRVLAGACAIPRSNGTILLSSTGRNFILTPEQFTRVQVVAKKVLRETLEPQGLNLRHHWDMEDMFTVEAAARAAYDQLALERPEQLRVCFLRSDNLGPGYYRATQPTGALHQYTTTIKATTADWLNMNFGQKYDVIVACRTDQPASADMLMRLQAGGKVIVFETDDDVNSIPDWNPAKAHYSPERIRTWNFVAAQADGVIVATEELRDLVGRPAVTHVCHNAVHAGAWPMQVRQQRGPHVTLLWSGSDTHEMDLALIVPVLRRVLETLPEVRLTFVGYMPTAFGAGAMDGGHLRYVVDPKYRGRVTLLDGCPTSEWAQRIAQAGGDIALAPLVDCPFNRAKSELRILESWALGIPVIASPVAPYARAIRDAENGFLCAQPKDWENAIRTLVKNPATREMQAAGGLQSLRAAYTTEKIAGVYEKALLTIARGKVPRPECAAMIEAKCKEWGA